MIGIQNYGEGTELWKPLKGPRNDITLMRSVLTSERFGFRDSEIVTLIDEDATYEKIKTAFVELAEQSQPGDLVYIHYSGHGSTVPDASGDELPIAGQPGHDSTLVPFDARAAGVHEILDDEIDIWLGRLRCRSVNVVFVADSCHSGTITRGPSSVANRTAPKKDTRDYAWSTTLADEIDEIRGCIPADDRFVRISASQDHQLAIEFLPPGQRKRYGLLTWHWARALEASRPTDSYTTLFTRLQALIDDRRGQRQQPLLEGAGQTAVLDGRFTDPVRELAVLDAGRSSIVFRGGLLRGVTRGSVFRKRGTGGDGEPTAVEVELSIVGPQTSGGVRPASGTIAVGDLFVEEVRAYPFPRLRVFVWDDESGAPAVVGDLQDRVREIEGVELVTSADHPDMILRIHSEGDTVRCSILDDSEAPFGGGNIDPEFLSVVMNGATAAEALTHNLVRIEQNRSILGFLGEFDAEAGGVKTELLSLTFPAVSDQASATTEWWLDGHDLTAPGLTHSLLASTSAGPQQLGVGNGDIVVFRIENTSDRLVYVYLANLMPNGQIKVRRGAGDQKEAKLEPGEVELVAPTEIDDREGLVDRYLWLISSEPVEAWVLEGLPLRTKAAGTMITTSLDQLLERVSIVGERGNSLDVAGPVELAVQRFDLAIQTNQ